MRLDHTFIVLAYKENPFLEDCIASLKSQSVASAIVITTSTPNSHIASIADRHGLDVIINPEQRGIGADWNFALAQARTRFVTLAHQDDVYSAQFLAQSLAALDVTSRAALVFTGAREIDDDGQPRTSKVSSVKSLLLGLFARQRSTVEGRRARLMLSFGNPVSCSAITFDRAVIGDFKFSESLASNLDWDAWVRLVERGERFAVVSAPLVGRRYNDMTETSHLLRDGRRGVEDRIMFQRLWPRPLSSLLSRVYALGY